jgi:hypothetical protein
VGSGLTLPSSFPTVAYTSGQLEVPTATLLTGGFTAANTAEMLLLTATFAQLSCNQYAIAQNDVTPLGDLCHIICELTNVLPTGWTDCTYP